MKVNKLLVVVNLPDYKSTEHGFDLVGAEQTLYWDAEEGAWVIEWHNNWAESYKEYIKKALPFIGDELGSAVGFIPPYQPIERI